MFPLNYFFLRLVGANFLSFYKESLCHSIYVYQQHDAFAMLIFH